MAQMYPPRIAQGTPRSERDVFERLAQLDDDYLVFHSVPWQGKRHGKQGDGEADFVIAHPNRGVLVLEVKGGTIHVENGGWISESRNGDRHKIRNPFEQASDSKFRLRDYLGEHIPRLGGPLRIGHGVVFPAVEVEQDLSPDAPKEIIIDRYDLKSMEASIERLMRHWEKPTRLDDQQFSALRKALAPTHKIRITQKHRIEETVEQLIELTDQQVGVLRLLKRQRRALITGGAGTGKTVLAVEKAKQLATEGFSVLLLCFNAPLGEQLAEQLGGVEVVTAGHFHKFAKNLVDRAELGPSTWPDDYWDAVLPELMPAAAENLGVSFDAIIVDEGQDFHANWWTSLELLLNDSDDGVLYVFADDHQDLYRTGWEPPFESESFALEINCRNTVEIAERVNAMFDRDEASLGVNGQLPGFLPGQGKQAVKALANFIGMLLREGTAPSSIAILTQKKRMAEALRGQEVEGVKLVAPGKTGVVVETIHRFKGLEADAVGVWLEDLDDHEDRVLAYVGMSRARALLLVVAPEEVKAQLDWPS